ncbi:hypothetical protein [Candidatus Amarobacter glycogenicus]|uniref:hypothetical protein n=1 Tax=Candidatus Amarobacter glycogenicus TaxID=3140699 RepID=UPI003135A0DB|nr:hypothetical protein [Dehalococcoidia bacterium]
MRSQTNRQSDYHLALLTAFVLTLVTGGILLSDRLAAVLPLCRRCPVAAAVTPAADPAVQPTDSNATIAAYEAVAGGHQALQDAYAQINALQAGQNQPISGFKFGVRTRA